MPEAETDPNPAPLSSTAPGRASCGGGVDGGGPWLGPPLLPAPGCRRSLPLLTEHRAWGWSWRDRAGEKSELLGGGTPEDSALAPLLPTLLPWGGGPESGQLSGSQGGVSQGRCCPRAANQPSFALAVTEAAHSLLQESLC